MSIGNVSATISANAQQFISEFGRADNEARRKTAAISASIDKLQSDVRKKFSLGQIGTSVLSGLGIGSGFAIAEKAAEQVVKYFKEAAEAAKIIEDVSAKSLAHVQRMVELRRSDLTSEKQLAALQADFRAAQNRFNSASADKYRVKSGFFGNFLGNEVIPKTNEEQAQIQKFKEEMDAADYALQKFQQTATRQGVEEKLNDFFVSIERGAEKIETSVNTSLRDFFYTIDNPPDISGVEAELKSFFDSVENGADIIDDKVNVALRDFFYSIDNPPEVEKWTQYQQGLFDIFQSIGDRSAATFSQMVLTGENALDSLLQSVADAFLQLTFRMGVVNPLLNAAFGLTGSSILPAFFGVGAGKASGGPVEGGMLYRVNENGPEYFRPNANGTIIPADRIGNGGGGGVHYSIDARGASVDAVRELRNMMLQLNASVEPRAVAAVKTANKTRK